MTVICVWLNRDQDPTQGLKYVSRIVAVVVVLLLIRPAGEMVSRLFPKEKIVGSIPTSGIFCFFLVVDKILAADFL